MARVTRQSQAIQQVVTGSSRPLLAQEVLEKAQQQVPKLGIATVYRNLKQLVDERLIKVVTLPGDNPRYEAADRPHHHHFYCQQCQRVFDIEACPGSLDDMLPPGFSCQHHDLTLYGRCRDCQA